MYKVSVIVPVYNHAQYLSERIESILAQTYRDFELIVLDDASTDNSREIINGYRSRIPGIIIHFNDQNSGNPFKQWNKGVALAKGEFIWIAESDDFADKQFLEKSVFEITKSNHIGLVYCDSWIQDEEIGIRYRDSQRTDKRDGLPNLHMTEFFLHNPIPNVSSVLFRKSAFMKAFNTETSLRYCGDWMLYYNVHLTSGISYLHEPLNTFRLHGGSQYHKYYRSNLFLREVLQVYRRILNSSTFSIRVSMMMISNIFKRLFVRILYVLDAPSFFLPKMPRSPKEVEFMR